MLLCKIYFIKQFILIIREVCLVSVLICTTNCSDYIMETET